MNRPFERRLADILLARLGEPRRFLQVVAGARQVGKTTLVEQVLARLDVPSVFVSADEPTLGLQKYAGQAVRQRGSSPKLQVLNTALMTAQSGLSPDEARSDREFRGRLVESAVGAHLANAAAGGACELFYWRERNREVDFVVRTGRTVIAIEVKSGRAPVSFPGLSAFAKPFKPKRTLLVGGDGISPGDFLTKPVEHWLQA